MEKVTRYQQILMDYIKEYAEQWSTSEEDTFQMIFDTERHHYLLIGLGWSKTGRTYFVPFHFDLVGEKVWIQENLTEVQVGDELVSRGIEKSDIVPGLLDPAVRKYAGYAVA